jgi:transcription elongation GreA/GreB family factor
LAPGWRQRSLRLLRLRGAVGFGSRVTFRMKGALRTMAIVGDDEADPAEGRLAFSAPLARALMGAAAGDEADFAGETDAIEVAEITRSDSFP